EILVWYYFSLNEKERNIEILKNKSFIKGVIPARFIKRLAESVNEFKEKLILSSFFRGRVSSKETFLERFVADPRMDNTLGRDDIFEDILLIAGLSVPSNMPNSSVHSVASSNMPNPSFHHILLPNTSNLPFNNIAPLNLPATLSFFIPLVPPNTPNTPISPITTLSYSAVKINSLLSPTLILISPTLTLIT
ncbi:2142_t:CDS:2, partial [Funneliformis geosporum]